MTLTNTLQLPQPIVDAILNDDYNPGNSEFTTNQLIRPVRINTLSKNHSDQISEDVADRIFALFGQAMHGVLDRAKSDRYVVKKRYFMDFEGTRISGEIDVFDKETHTLSDYKLCSRYVVNDGVKPEWEAQDNMNAFLMAHNGVYVAGMNIVAIFRDWSKMAAARQRQDYPQRQVAILDVKPWPEQKTIDFIRSRIAANKFTGDPPLCTPEERWQSQTQWALMKKGNKRASKLYDTKEDADSQCQHNNHIGPRLTPQWSVEERPGMEKRCLFYCPVSKFCDYGRLVNEP